MPADRAIAKMRGMRDRTADMRPMWKAEESIMRGIISAKMPRLKRTKKGQAALVSMPAKIRYRVTKAGLLMTIPEWMTFHTNGTVHLPVRNPFPFAFKNGEKTNQKIYAAGVARRITAWVEKGKLS